MWATKQPRQTRDEVLRGLDVTTKRVNLWSGCRWIPELRLPLGHDAYNFARMVVPNVVLAWPSKHSLDGQQNDGLVMPVETACLLQAG